MQTAQESRETVQSVVRAIDILCAFTVERPVLGVSEIATQLNLNRTTVHRLLTTLEGCGAVRRDPATQKYTIGTLVVRLSNVFFQQSDVRAVGLPVIAKLRDVTKQTSALHIREEWSRITIAQVESRQDLRVTYPDLGTPIPLHLGAPGKVMLAYLPCEEIDRYLDAVPLTPATPHSPVDRDALQSELDQIRNIGYAITCQERRSGVLSVATPFFHADGTIVGSVNISAPIHRVSDEQRAEIIPLVKVAGQEISDQFGYHPR